MHFPPAMKGAQMAVCARPTLVHPVLSLCSRYSYNVFILFAPAWTWFAEQTFGSASYISAGLAATQIPHSVQTPSGPSGNGIQWVKTGTDLPFNVALQVLMLCLSPMHE